MQICTDCIKHVCTKRTLTSVRTYIITTVLIYIHTDKQTYMESIFNHDDDDDDDDDDPNIKNTIVDYRLYVNNGRQCAIFFIYPNYRLK